jgi:phosphoglycerol geranylgeranyltransferase
VGRPGGEAGAVRRRLARVLEDRGAGYLVLLDPDRMATDALVDLAGQAEAAGADALLVGSSLSLKPDFADAVAAIRGRVDLPVIIFPGSAFHVVPGADAILFLSLLSGRNPQFLVAEQVKAAPLIRAYGLEALAVGYLLVDSGERTSVEFMSATTPIPRTKPDIAMAHALAAQYFGMQYVFMDGGSGGRMAVPVEMVRAVAGCVTVPVIVGGGIRRPEEARAAVEAGASFIVTGNVLEADRGETLLAAFAEAVHGAGGARAGRRETLAAEVTSAFSRGTLKESTDPRGTRR